MRDCLHHYVHNELEFVHLEALLVGVVVAGASVVDATGAVDIAVDVEAPPDVAGTVGSPVDAVGVDSAAAVACASSIVAATSAVDS